MLGELGPTDEPKTVIENDDGSSEVVNTNEMVDDAIAGIEDFEEVEAMVTGDHEEPEEVPADESVNEEKKTIVAEVGSEVTGESVLS